LVVNHSFSVLNLNHTNALMVHVLVMHPYVQFLVHVMLMKSDAKINLVSKK